jgi:heptosyltransferase-1
MNILIVKPSSLGDIVHTLPVVGMIRQQFPDSVISWVVNDSYAELLDLCPDIDTRIVFKRKRLARPRHWLEIFSFIRELRSQKFDIAIDFQGLFRSAVIARLSGAKKRVGFRNAREGAPWFYTDRVLLPANLKHAQDKNMFLARAALHLPDTEPTTALASSEVDAVKVRKIMREQEIDPDRTVLAVAPAARWGTKTWPPEFFARVLSELHEQTSPSAPTIVCVGTADERPTGDRVCEKAACPVVNLMGETDLGALAELLRKSAVLLTNDSGPMHLAAAVGTPVVALFGATDPALTGPYGDCHAVFMGECEHAPCMQRKCKMNHSPECHGTINAAKVVEALKKHVVTSPEPETKIEDMLAS